MRKVIVSLIVMFGLGVGAGAALALPMDPSFAVMTQNLYLGADLAPMFTAPPAQIPFAAGAVFGMVHATDFPSRAKALANEIAAKQPLLIGVQEAELWRTGPPDSITPNPTPATNVVFDYKQLLLSELAARGLMYGPVAEVTNTDVELPAVTLQGLTDLRITDRALILARTDLPASTLTLSNPQGGNFATSLPVPVGGQVIPILRGWASVDVELAGQPFRFVTTHLESLFDPVGIVQGQELLAGPLNTSLPVILVGDINSDAAAGGIAYGNFVQAGLKDGWLLGGGGSGFTCCQAENLLNLPSDLDQRIDTILFKGPFHVMGAETVGDMPGDRTPSGLWPSDHAGVVLAMNIPAPPSAILLLIGLVSVAGAARVRRRLQ